MQQSVAQKRKPFSGCKLSLQLNGLNVLTLEESALIKDVLTFVGRNQNSLAGRLGQQEGEETGERKAAEAKYVKVVVFDDQNRVLAVKNKNSFILPGGRIEWDDDDAEAAARREVFEAADIALGIVQPVTTVKTKDSRTIVFVGRLRGEDKTSGDRHRFMTKETFFGTPGGRSDLVRSLIETAHRILVSEEIKTERDETAMTGNEKYSLRSLV